MKKLIIAAFAVAMAATVQAAACSWEIARDSAFAYNTVYVIGAGNYATVLAALDEGGTGIADKLAAWDLDSKVIQAGNKGSMSGQIGIGDTDPDTTAFYAVLIKTGSGQTAADGMDYVFSSELTVSDFKSANAYASGSSLPTGKLALNDKWTGASGTIGVPEPTSGLLLLLGVAGLALKRKRA